MLVLTRKQGELIHIGDDVVIKLIKTGNGAVKIGIEAPSHVKVLRGELHAKQQAASEAETPSVLFQKTAGRSIDVDFAGYFPLPQTA